MNKIIFIADFFANQILGGGELNNQALISVIENKGYSVLKVQCADVTLDLIERHKDANFIISNHSLLHVDAKKKLRNLCYVIYEHDHQYLRRRNPAEFTDFIAPKSEIVNYDFYKNAVSIFCQSSFHKSIMESNLGFENIVNLSGNLWESDILDYLEQLSAKQKSPKCSVMDSPISHKNTRQSVRFCEYKNYEYQLVSSGDYRTFLDLLSNNQKFVFFPKTPETLSRVIVEARMCGMSVITNDRVGATKEDWYSLKGVDLINKVRQMREDIPNKVLEALNVN
mgnify:CR=1 FL=1